MQDKTNKKYQMQLLEYTKLAQRKEAVDFLNRIAKDSGYIQLLNKVLEPVLTELGELWMKEKVSLAVSYVASKIAEDMLLIASESDEWKSLYTEKKPTVIIANIEDDFHALGRKMVVTFLRAANWQVVDMGNDISAEEIIDKAVELNAPIVGLSAMMYTTAMNIKKVREEIDKRDLSNKIKLAVGGAVFKVRPKLVKEVGGDGTASSAMLVPELFDSLIAKIKD